MGVILVALSALSASELDFWDPPRGVSVTPYNMWLCVKYLRAVWGDPVFVSKIQGCVLRYS